MRAMLVIVSVLALTAGCGGRASEDAQAPSPPAVAPAAAADMCVEHGVLEAICTKCHPQLVPVFQAKGDWCAEHGFPMSVCPTHHPERGGRPEVPVAADEAPASGTKVRFRTPEIARDAGIETVPAVRGKQGVGVIATATLVADASHLAVVNARAAGVVRTIHADVGTRVARGAPLATLESSVVGQDRSRLTAAQARAAAAEANHLRERELYEKGVSARREVEEAQREWETAKAEVAAASSTLGMIGTSGGTAGSYVLTAPISGVLSRRTATVGTLVDADDALFEIVDVSELWAEIDVPEAHASRLRTGQRVVLTVEGLPGQEFHGTVRFISPVIDPHTRTAQARAAVPNRDGRLRANMYARARILDEPDRTSVLVPASAVQDARGVQLVFVQLATDAYEARRVKATPAENQMVAITADLRPGERVVTTGSFLLKTETLKESIGAGCCEIEPPKR
jgi:cobalt-zinc-cadmium efflux system membrane fusion protein